MRVYRLRKLIEGWRVDPKFKEFQMVAAPDAFRGQSFKFICGREEMIINDWGSEAVHFLTFKDKYGRGKEYTLGYFIWKPDKSQQTLFPTYEEKDYLFA